MAYEYANDPTNPDAVPLYNDNILKFWNWFNSVWSCDDWLTWHKAMSAKYGVASANEKFLGYWNDLATGSSAIDCRTFNTTFRNYMSKVGILDSLYSGVGVIAKPIGGAVDVVTNVSDVVTNVSKGVSTASKTLKILLPLFLVIVVVLGIVYVSKQTKFKSK